MPKPRKNESSSRRYNSYSEKTLLKALTAIKEGKISINKAAIKYNIAKGTLMNKVHGKHDKSFGAEPFFTQEEEETLVDYVKTIKGWGYPFTMIDLKFLGKFYLDVIGKEPSRFGAENMPGREWASRFMKKHKNALDHNCHLNVHRTKKEKAALLKTEFFDRLQESLGDEVSEVPPSRIFHFSLANMSHDSFAVHSFFKQSKKYAPYVTDIGASVMFCGSATGWLIPPFVVYKAERMSESWVNGGPKDTKYSISPSGCFDPGLFLEWFQALFIPYVKNLQGRIILLGDYPSSLFSPQVLELAKENNIVFTCIPDGVSPPSCHPFEISVYAKLAYQWELLLNEWRAANGREPVDRRLFPGLLNQLLTVTCETSSDGDFYSEDLVEGFKLSGVVPFISVNTSQKVGNILHTAMKKESVGSKTVCRQERVNEEFSQETFGTETSATSVSHPQRKTPECSYKNILVKKEDQKLTKEPVVVYLLLDYEQETSKS